MTKKPIVSVIVPVYKAEESLGRCVDSILAGTLAEIEVILVDDGSPDRCGALCDGYAARDPRVKVVHRENGGESAARNTGLEHADGRYIEFVDSDDWVEPEITRVLYEAMEAYQPDLVACTFFRESPGHSEPMTLGFAGTQPPSRPIMEFARGRADAALRFGTSWAKLYRRDVIDRHGLRFEETKIANEDTHFNFRYAKVAGSAYFVDRPLYHYVSPYGRVTMTTVARPRAFEMNERMYAAVEDAIGAGLSEDERRMLNRHYLDKTLLVMRMLGNTFGDGVELRGKLAEIVGHGKIRDALEKYWPVGSQENGLIELLREKDLDGLERWALGLEVKQIEKA
jgi:glycosyltransferase involved in cell wall biosynthesis